MNVHVATQSIGAPSLGAPTDGMVLIFGLSTQPCLQVYLPVADLIVMLTDLFYLFFCTATWLPVFLLYLLPLAGGTPPLWKL